MIRVMEERDSGVPQLTVTRSEQDDVHVIALRGELDLNSIDELHAAIAAASAGRAPRVCLDLGELRFIDSTGLAAIIRAHLAIVEAGGMFAVVAGTGPVHRTLETTGLMEMLSVVGDRGAALADLA